MAYIVMTLYSYGVYSYGNNYVTLNELKVIYLWRTT